MRDNNAGSGDWVETGGGCRRHERGIRVSFGDLGLGTDRQPVHGPPRRIAWTAVSVRPLGFVSVRTTMSHHLEALGY